MTDPPIIDVWDPNTFDEDLCSVLKDQTDLIRGYFLREHEISVSYKLAQGSDRPLRRPPNLFEAEFIPMRDGLTLRMAKRVIRAFHYTRMTDREVAQACDNGLHLSTLDSLRQRLQALVETGDLTSNDVRMLEAASPFDSQLEIRQSKFWMTSHPIPIEDSRVERLLRYWGGEVASRLAAKSLLAKREQIGCPRIVEIAVPLSATDKVYHFSAASAAVAAFGKSLDCYEGQDAFDLCAKMALQATAILRVHSAGEEEFEGMGQTYPSSVHRECPAQL